MEIDISQFGKGAIQTPIPIRKKQYHIFGAAPMADWSVPYMVENGFALRQRNQNGSSSCTSQATGYYTEALDKVEHGKDEKHSNRYVYSQVALPTGGAYIWKAMSVPLRGVASADSVPDGDSSESIMRDASLNAGAVLEARADKYAVIPRSSIDQMATIINDYSGFVTGFNGSSGMFGPLGWTNIPSTVEWGHAVYVCGYEIRNGKKCLRYKNSWSAEWGDHGYGFFPEEFVNSGYLFDCYVYASIEDIDPMSMLRFIKIEGGKDIWLVRDNKRSLIYNAAAMSLIGDWSKIEIVLMADFNAIPDTGIVLAAIGQE